MELRLKKLLNSWYFFQELQRHEVLRRPLLCGQQSLLFMTVHLSF